MSNQYPLPSGYPPPGATYAMNQPPPGNHGQDHMPQGYPTPPDPNAGGTGYYAPGPPGSSGPPYSSGASYPVVHIPGEGYQPSELPYQFQRGTSGDGPHIPPDLISSPAASPPYVCAPVPPQYPAGPPMSPQYPAGPPMSPQSPPASVYPEHPRPVVPADESRASGDFGGAAPPTGTTDEHIGGMAQGDSRTFYIVSEVNQSVLDVRKENPKPGASVGLYKRKKQAAPNQLWYIGTDGFIRSKLNDLAISIAGNDKEMITATYTGDPRQQWLIDGKKIVNKMFCTECLTVKKSLVRVKDDADVVASEYQGTPLQHWKIDYAGE